MSLTVTTCWLLLALGWAVVEGQYVNDFDQNTRFECPANQILSFIGSIHSNQYQDRRWQFQCSQAPGTTEGCHWTDYLNEFHKSVRYICPRNEVISGMMSINDNHYEDRKFKVQCCSVSGKSTSHCYTTGFVNYWDDVMNYPVPDGEAIIGVYSMYADLYEDRRFDFTVCELA